MAPLLVEARARIERERDAGNFGLGANFHLAMALVAAAEGNTEVTEHFVRTWLRETTRDLAELVNLRHYACRALAMADAVSAALECLRSGLAEPSQVTPFIEPSLPYYDSMRDDPRFLDFVEVLDGAH